MHPNTQTPMNITMAYSISPLKTNYVDMKTINLKHLIFLFAISLFINTSCKKDKIDDKEKEEEIIIDDSNNNDPTVCNGNPKLCNKKYNEVAFATTHNSFNHGGGGVSYTFPNQQFGLTKQMEDGVRALMLDVYDVNGVATVYHGFQFTGSEPFINNLFEIRNFLRDNPNEIITIILECYVPFSVIEDNILTSGLSEYLYTKTPGEDWKTLKEMIKSNKRLVIFSDENDAVKQDWYHYVWQYAVETSFSVNDVSQFDCGLNRGDSNNDLFILNHFATNATVGTGSLALSTQANASPFLKDRVLQCEQETGKRVNFLTVDFYAEGSLFETINFLNNRD
jgi:hypothetical protein